MQLNLFEWDLIAVGSGYQALAEFNFVEAERCFLSVLKQMPDHPQAGAGLKEQQFWRKRYLEAMALPTEPAAILLWQEIQGKSLQINRYHGNLRRRLLQYLHDLLIDRPRFFHPPDLCLGHLQFLLGKLSSAESNLRSLTVEQPGFARLHFLLAETLWHQGRDQLAGSAYAQALLVDPEDITTMKISYQELSACIEEYGASLAPVYGFFSGLLPLAMPPEDLVSKEARCCLLLRTIELARRNNDYQAMIDGRRELKQLAPEIFHDYLGWLDGKQLKPSISSNPERRK